MTIASGDLTLANEDDSVSVDDYNLIINTLKQLLDNGGGGGSGSSDPQDTVKLTVGSETWTLAGYKHSDNSRWMLLKYSDVSDITPNTMDAYIVLGN